MATLYILAGLVSVALSLTVRPWRDSITTFSICTLASIVKHRGHVDLTEYGVFFEETIAPWMTWRESCGQISFNKISLIIMFIFLLIGGIG